ncbi:hypothetical protein [Chitinophaga pinensis]|uniref:Uncharacterized protein n=1 Tax=Chitinophaga pinensis (strain ATCC 43595 / DSM 2588 / LMG 13176 / NBRC 15968 / NCIMB 11800 / UQM 2034) TaxID=485918 RepID=A0A979GSV6_CHIPD|nr:hypothetical protein [Chitinophaga pinensis]ACU63337.1 hypothetical protein Cpin_5919 [Chitinophaga pinensis DSM 2588]
MTANRIVQHIFQQPDIRQVDESALERLVSSYPYFTAARLLLARKQYTVNKNLLSPAVKKAQQYSNNMHYFYRFVTTDEKSLAVPEEAPVVPVPAAQEEEKIAASGQSATPVVEAIALTPVAEPAPVAPPEAPVTAATVETTPVPVLETPVPQAVVEIPVTAPQPVPAVVAPEAPVTAATIAATQPSSPVQETSITVYTPEIPAAIAPAPEEDTEEEITVTANEVVASPIPEAPVMATPVATPAPQPVPVQEPAPVPQPVAQTIAETAAEAEPIKIFPLDTSAEPEGALTFQPLYSDDYFAYKRLKDPEHAEGLNEKGAAEMKSFTSWLRDMKQTFAEKASKKWYQEQMQRSYEDSNPEVSEKVEKMAMESITLNNDIVSETLAEIWARQQQYQTAIHIYQKLSLLNPNKSAYFAQKIKELQLLTEKS